MIEQKLEEGLKISHKLAIYEKFFAVVISQPIQQKDLSLSIGKYISIQKFAL